MDTVKTSQRFYPELPNHKLDTVCQALDIDLQHHHNALDDSLACANILLTEAQALEPSNSNLSFAFRVKIKFMQVQQ